jgi:hypothetical protein
MKPAVSELSFVLSRAEKVMTVSAEQIVPIPCAKCYPPEVDATVVQLPPSFAALERPEHAIGPPQFSCPSENVGVDVLVSKLAVSYGTLHKSPPLSYTSPESLTFRSLKVHFNNTLLSASASCKSCIIRVKLFVCISSLCDTPAISSSLKPSS